MRLLNVKTHLLEEFFEPRVPKYIILSHRWEEDEVLFRDIGTRNYKKKKGFKKVKLICEMAIEKSVGYVWIDTCCIDKSSSAELSEAINSMFNWYRLSSFCYVYLSDIKSASVQLDVTHSVWFTRGWTLQELIAPPNLVFYDQDGLEIGTRHRLASRISQKTRIAEKMLLEGRDCQYVLADFTAAQKMAWASNRQTTRIEDRAYSLLGMFGVNMPLLYGEGTRAFARLQEEILRTDTDLSILSWPLIRQDTRGAHTLVALFAESPDNFDGCDDVVRSFPAPGVAPGDTSFAITNTGLEISQAPIVIMPESKDDIKLVLSLGCCRRSDPYSVLALKLQTRRRAATEHSAQSKRKICYTGWAYQEVGVDLRVIRIMFFEPVVLLDWSTITISKQTLSIWLTQFSNPHEMIWLQLPRSETGWTNVTDWPPDTWDRYTLSCLLRCGHDSKAHRLDNGWQYAALHLDNDSGEGISLHVKFNLNLSEVFFALLPRGHNSPYEQIGQCKFQKEMNSLIISSTSKVKVWSNHLQRDNRTIFQLQMAFERLNELPKESLRGTASAGAGPSILCELDDFPNLGRLERLADVHQLYLDTTARLGGRSGAVYELCSTEIDARKVKVNLLKLRNDYNWRTPECVNAYLRTVLLSLDPDDTEGALFWGYAGPDAAQYPSLEQREKGSDKR